MIGAPDGVSVALLAGRPNPGLVLPEVVVRAVNRYATKAPAEVCNSAKP